MALLRQHTSDNEDESSQADPSDGDSEREPDSDDECGIPLKDLKGAGHTVTRCCDMFCNVHKAIQLVMLSKQEEQSDSEDEDERQTRKEALDRV